MSFAFTTLGLICILSASIIKGKNMKLILFLLFVANAAVATGYLFTENGINGAVTCYIGAAQTIINYFFECKNKPIPKWLVAIYAIAFVSVNLAFAGFTVPCTIAIVASLMYVMSIGQKNGAKFRIWTLGNVILWGIYDIVTPAFAGLITHIPQLIFTIAGMIIHDIKNEK